MARKRRGNGEGIIYRRKDGRWIGQYTVHTPDGRKYRWVSGKTRAEAAAKLTRAMADRDGGLVLDGQDRKLGEYLGRWLDDSVRGSVKPITFESYASLVRLHIVPMLGAIKLRDLTPAQLQGFYRNRLDAGLAPRTVRYMHALLHKALKQALKVGLVARNATEAVDPPRAHIKEIRPLTPEQAAALLGAAKGDRLEALYALAVTTGLRQGELLALRWEDVDLERGVVAVKRTLTRTKSGPLFGAPKTPKSRRSVGLIRSAVGALECHRGRQQEERAVVGAGWQDLDLVFCSLKGTPLHRGNLNTRSFKLLLERAGLPRTVRFHDLRHTAATLLLVRGTHPKLVQELLGHSSIVITLDTYSHVLPSMQEQVVADMEGALSLTPPERTHPAENRDAPAR